MKGFARVGSGVMLGLSAIVSLNPSTAHAAPVFKLPTYYAVVCECDFLVPDPNATTFLAYPTYQVTETLQAGGKTYLKRPSDGPGRYLSPSEVIVETPTSLAEAERIVAEITSGDPTAISFDVTQVRQCEGFAPIDHANVKKRPANDFVDDPALFISTRVLGTEPNDGNYYYAKWEVLNEAELYPTSGYLRECSIVMFRGSVDVMFPHTWGSAAKAPAAPSPKEQK